MDFAFDTLGWDKVIHIIAPDNTASQGVAARLGSTNLGPTQMPPPLDSFVVEAWGQSAEQWRARKSLTTAPNARPQKMPLSATTTQAPP
jgi:RimJ/RimL family protein N-acetyltransferase